MSQPSRISMLETMMLIRAHEERLAANAGSSPGTCTAVGQEAAAVGVVGALQPRDRILTNHRSAGHLLARGADPGRLMAEVMGRADGYCKGKSGSLHVPPSSAWCSLPPSSAANVARARRRAGAENKATGARGITASSARPARASSTSRSTSP
jgi:TPP-dependent pyruvate/acetoin dehydrogenase alpha subunit